MKRIGRIIPALALAALCHALPAEAQLAYDNAKYDYDILVSQITGVGAPVLKENRVIFTADSSSRFTGIAFDFENFRQIHPFSVRKIRDFDGNETASYKFFVLDLPKDLMHLQYRLIVDGLWTVDPLNPDARYDTKTGMKLSQLDLNRQIEPATEYVRADSIATRLESGSNTVRFVHKGESGQKIRLGGSFTNWDSWIYELEEVEPGLYLLELPLNEGTWFYSYYTGISSFIDETNPERAYTADGRMASVITVKN